MVVLKVKKDPKQAIDEVSEMGLDGIELTFGESIPEDITKEGCDDLKQYAAEKGVGLKTLASGFYWGCSLASPDPEEREKALIFSQKYIKSRCKSWCRNHSAYPRCRGCGMGRYASGCSLYGSVEQCI